MRTAATAHVTFLTSPSIYLYLYITIDIVTYIEDITSPVNVDLRQWTDIVTYIEDITSPVNVNLRQWTDIVTYIEDITSPVNVPSSMDRYRNVHRRHYKSSQCTFVNGQIS